MEIESIFAARAGMQARTHLLAALAAVAAYVLLTEALVRFSRPGLNWAAEEATAYLGFGMCAVIYARLVGMDIPMRLGGRIMVAGTSVLFAVIGLLVTWRLLGRPPHTPTRPAASVYALRFAITGGLIVPFTEEVLFRGLLQGGIERIAAEGRAISWLSIVATASIFGLLHWPGLYGQKTPLAPLIVLSAFVSGLLFGYMRDRLRTIVPGMALHALGNLAGF